MTCRSAATVRKINRLGNEGGLLQIKTWRYNLSHFAIIEPTHGWCIEVGTLFHGQDEDQPIPWSDTQDVEIEDLQPTFPTASLNGDGHPPSLFDEGAASPSDLSDNLADAVSR